MARRYSKDANHELIKQFTIQRMGCRAWDMHKHGDGLPDFLCWDWEYSGALFIVEVKVIEPLKRRAIVKADAIKRLTPAELKFFEQFGDCPNLMYWWSEECARRAIEAAREAVA